MILKASRLWASIFLVLIVQFAHSQNFGLVSTTTELIATPAVSSTSSSALSKITEAAGTDQDGNESPQSNARPDPGNVSGSMTAFPSSTHDTTSSALPTATSGGLLDNSTYYNATIPAGQLPLTPQLTPGWGVAGVILVVTGVLYTLVGIKNRWIHTYFSTAYMTALGVAVLIIYVMNVPVSNALQGGYVVAVIMSGCAVGGVAMFFKELTEGFGCALGGFCISMWLLCLVPGGLLHTAPSKSVLIASFTLVGFALYFSRWTRDWALIVLIAFGGSTVTVLGIDCFSRAGLKEFWAYIWAINDNLFPLGADTYPVTKGIRVETAAVIFLFLAGIISQVKLWRIVREKRAKRAADRAQDQRDLEQEEENVGRQIEESNARERRQWEKVYGDGTADSMTESRVTDVGDTGSEKRLQPGYVSSKRKSSADAAEMSGMSESDQSRHGPEGLMATDDAEDGKVTVRVAADDVPESATDDEPETLDEKADAKNEANGFVESRCNPKRTTESKRVSQVQTATEPPEVIPLPFTVPEASEVKSEDDRSSIATFADDAETAISAAPRDRSSLAEKLPKAAVSLLRNVSHMTEHRVGGADCASGVGLSTENLAVGGKCEPEDDEASLAATVDGESLSGEDLHPAPQDAEQPDGPEETELAVESPAQLGQKSNEVPIGNGLAHDTTSSQPVCATTSPKAVPVVEQEEQPLEDAGAHMGGAKGDEKVAETYRAPSTVPNPHETNERAKSVASGSSVPTSLTKERLPSSLSRVAMSYRTNEWAKHLSHAECPEPDELYVPTARTTKKTKEPEERPEERPVPVNVEELQQTAEDGGPAPSVRRSFSASSEMAKTQNDSRQRPPKQEPPLVTNVAASSFTAGGDASLDQRTPKSPTVPPGPALKKTPSGIRHSSSTFMPIVEEPIGQSGDGFVVKHTAQSPKPLSRHSSVATFDATSQVSVPPANRLPTPGVVSYASPQTLFAQREMFLRNKSQGNMLTNTQDTSFASQGPDSDADSLNDYSIYAAALSLPDPDDVPLSQRKEIMRQSSMMSLSSSSAQQATAHARPLSNIGSTESLAFNSHQPKRASMLPSFAARETQLANFRQSVQHGLRSGTPIMANTGRETPFRSATLLGSGREAEIQRNIEMQRTVLMGQKEAEAQRREMQRREKENANRAFDERMRSGDMLEAHREAMRRMQKVAK